MKKAEPRRRYDWPQVALVAIVGALALGALVVLEVKVEDIANVPASQWVMIASTIAGAAGTALAAFRRPITEPAVVRIARVVEAESTAAAPAPAPIRTRDTDPPEGTP